MSLVAAASRVMESVSLPDALISAGISAVVGRTRRRLARVDAASEEAAFAHAMGTRPIAVRPDAANTQHYEVPAAFFGLVLGQRRKYSCCLYEGGAETLDAAEERALAETAAHAGLADGQAILELGCGWGSLSLWMAEHFPNATITAVSNSASQRQYIEKVAARLGHANLRVVTADMNDFTPGFSGDPGLSGAAGAGFAKGSALVEGRARFDRIVSVEMFEHMANWPALLTRARSWLKDDGRMFLHVFSHRAVPFLYDDGDADDWIAQYFFTGGIMPSHGLIRRIEAPFAVEEEWRWSGAHYARTARDWLANFDRNGMEVEAVLRYTYGSDAALWRRRWRVFFLATAGMFGHAGGGEWGVSHYRLRPL